MSQLARGLTQSDYCNFPANHYITAWQIAQDTEWAAFNIAQDTEWVALNIAQDIEWVAFNSVKLSDYDRHWIYESHWWEQDRQCIEKPEYLYSFLGGRLGFKYYLK